MTNPLFNFVSGTDDHPAPAQQRDWTGCIHCTVVFAPEGDAAPVADAPTGLFYDGPSYAGMRGACPEGYERGENYGGCSATRFNSLLVDDDEAVSGSNGCVATRGRP
jgi:hypothetical protein